MPKLLLASGNKAKLQELVSLLQELPYKLVTPSDIGINTNVDEVGKSLEENARLKAVTFADRSQLLTLADDSGLEVDALNGEPGVLSARYAGKNASDIELINHLLKRLNGIPKEKRQAKFRCLIAIATPDGQVRLCSGECYGFITLEPRGKQGFGYDPIFYLPQLGKTMAELPPEIKNQVSHRGQAARKASRLLLRIRDNKISDNRLEY
jgi:XTP/dITP diphosphohydrolase